MNVLYRSKETCMFERVSVMADAVYGTAASLVVCVCVCVSAVRVCVCELESGEFGRVHEGIECVRW